MAPKWLGKVPWATVAEFFLGWWKGRKKNDNGKAGGSVQPDDNERSLDSDAPRPAA